MNTSLLNTDGTSAIGWDAVVARADTITNPTSAPSVAGDLGRAPGRVQAGLRPGRRVRAFTLKAAHATPAEAELVRQAVVAGKYGAVAVAWRHPESDPPAVAAACPPWRIVRHDIERGPGAVSASIEILIEEV